MLAAATLSFALVTSSISIAHDMDAMGSDSGGGSTGAMGSMGSHMKMGEHMTMT